MSYIEKGHKGFLPKEDGWACKYCNCSFRTRRLLLAHNRDCEAKKKLAETTGYDSIGRIKNPNAYTHAAETLKRRYTSGELTAKGHKHTEETRKHLSETRIKYLESHGNYGLKWYVIDGIKVQGTWEKQFAEFLVSKGIKFERNRINFCKTHTYTPDFYCPDYDVYFEVKGFRRDRDIYKMYLVLEEHPNLHIKMIERAQLKNLDKIDIFKLSDFQELYHREDIDTTKFTNIYGTGATG